MRVGAVLVGVLAAGAAVGAQAPREALMDADRAFNRATTERGIDGWVEFAAPDAVFMPDGVDFVRGREAIRAAYAPMFARKGFSLTWEPIDASVAASGDLGYTLGRWTSRGVDAAGRPATRQGKYVTIWKKQPDGSWKAAVDVGNAVERSQP